MRKKFVVLAEEISHLDCYVQYFQNMGDLGTKCSTPESWSMNDSMKRNEYRDCQNLEDAYHSKDKVATIVYSEDFKKMCPGGSDEITTSQ